MRVTKQDLILEIARRRKIKIDVVKEILPLRWYFL